MLLVALTNGMPLPGENLSLKKAMISLLAKQGKPRITTEVAQLLFHHLPPACDGELFSTQTKRDICTVLYILC